MQIWTEVLQNSFADIWTGVIDFVPKLIVALVIFLVGWGIGALLDKVVAQIIRSLKVDNALRKVSVESFLQKAGFRLDSGMFVGGLVKWFIIVVFLVAAFDVLGLSQVNTFLQQVLGYLPKVIVSSLIILSAAIIAEAVQKVVSGGAHAAGISSANFAGVVSKWSIWIFAILVALDKLGIIAPFVQTIFMGIVVAIALALGLAFGLGGQDAAAKLIEKVKTDVANRHHQ